jgi:3-phosphoinositide dependent protein kinase-1
MTETTSTADYLVGVTIGQGAFGTVLYAEHKNSGKQVAIKVMDKMSLGRYPEQLAAALREQKVLRQLNNCQVTVDLLASFHDSQAVYLVLECCCGGDLTHIIHHGKDTKDWELNAAYLGLELIQALQVIHERKMIHADLKPSNVLFKSSGRLLLADFGCAIDWADQRSVGTPVVLHGTAEYSSPEVIQARLDDISPALDLWSYGCILYALWSGVSPFRAATEASVVERVLAHRTSGENSGFLSPSNIPMIWKDLIVTLLDPCPGNRPASDGDFTSLVSKFDSLIGIRLKPCFCSVEPDWMVKSKETEMRDGSIGWGAFLMD